MAKLFIPGVCLLAAGLAGCVAPDGTTEMPWDAISRREERGPDLTKTPAASAKAATRVDAVGGKVAAANSADLAKRPVFVTAGVPELLLFSKSDGQIVVSEGLVNRCETDDDLAALLAAELGKMAARAHADAPRAEDLPPDPGLHSDVVGGRMDPDQTRLAEQGLMGRRPAGDRRARQSAGPDPAVLSRGYLKKAGYDPEALQHVEPWLKEAAENADRRDFMKGR